LALRLQKALRVSSLVRNRERRDAMASRVRILSALIGVGLAAVAGAYWLTQGIHGPEYRELAENNRLRRIPIRAPRGVILDRGGRPLAENVPSYNLMLEPETTKDLEASLQFAAGILEADPLELHALQAKSRRERPAERALVAENLTLAQVARFELAGLEHPEFEIDVQHVRLYRHREQTAHVLGYLSEVGPADIAGSAGAYKRGDVVGRKGIEQQYEPVLRGVDGERVVVVDSRGRGVDEFRRAAPDPGTNLQLALDLDLQQTAQRLLQDKVGAVVAMDPKSGEILAMASSPAYDPNLFARRLRADDWVRLIEDKHHPLQNRAIQNFHSPGSTFKIVMALAGLSEGLITTQSRVYCGGSATFYNRRFRCWKPEGHGAVDLHGAIKHSCDVYFYTLGQRLGIERIAKYARLFGWGELTGIDMAGEKEGLVPDDAWSQRVRKHKWYPGETISVSIGQGPLLVTPLQMALMMSGVANGGRLPTPHLAQTGAPPRQVRGIAPEAWGPVRAALRAVVDSGTGHQAYVPGLAMGGKTGTVQVVAQHTWKMKDLAFEQRDHAWFVSFAPVEDPQLVVTVFVEHGGAGSSAAAPIAKGIYEAFVAKRPDLRRLPAL
jgi:penicillin-binding protein 2